MQERDKVEQDEIKYCRNNGTHGIGRINFVLFGWNIIIRKIVAKDKLKTMETCDIFTWFFEVE